MAPVYKIISESDCERARSDGALPPAPIDIADGYIHLSTEEQVLETARLHFAGRDDLVAVSFDAEALGPALKWEASRGGALFPHYYGDLPIHLALSARRLVRHQDGTFAFGERDL